jgi:hypothetical protein
VKSKPQVVVKTLFYLNETKESKIESNTGTTFVSLPLAIFPPLNALHYYKAFSYRVPMWDKFCKDGGWGEGK